MIIIGNYYYIMVKLLILNGITYKKRLYIIRSRVQKSLKADNLCFLFHQFKRQKGCNFNNFILWY